MGHVFISYKHGDGDFAEILVSKIKDAGFDVWIDEDDDKLPPGANWRDEIDRAIKDAFALIVIMTPEARISEYVTYEWGFAQGAEVTVIPIMLKPTKLHPRLEMFQYLDFTTSNRMARPWDILIKALKKASDIYKLRGIEISNDIPALIKQAVDA